MREQMVEPWATMRKTATAIRFLTWRLRTALISADEREDDRRVGVPDSCVVPGVCGRECSTP